MDKAKKLLDTVREAFMATAEIKTLYSISSGISSKAKEFDQAVNALADQLQSPIDDENRPKVDNLIDKLQDKLDALDDILGRTKTVITSLDMRK